MKYYFQEFFDYTEVWALLIPLFFAWKAKSIPAHLKPVKVFLIVSLIVNMGMILIWKRNKLGLNLPDYLLSNNFLYNTLSILRLLIFSWFFISLRQPFMPNVKRIIPVAFLILAIINFAFYEDFFEYQYLSSRLLATEAALQLFYCLQYFIFMLVEERPITIRKYPGFWVVTGLSIFMAVSFFIFLFFRYMIDHDIEFAIDIWDVSNIAFILMCLLIARAFYDEGN